MIYKRDLIRNRTTLFSSYCSVCDIYVTDESSNYNNILFVIITLLLVIQLYIFAGDALYYCDKPTTQVP